MNVTSFTYTYIHKVKFQLLYIIKQKWNTSTSPKMWCPTNVWVHAHNTRKKTLNSSTKLAKQGHDMKNFTKNWFWIIKMKKITNNGRFLTHPCWDFHFAENSNYENSRNSKFESMKCQKLGPKISISCTIPYGFSFFEPHFGRYFTKYPCDNEKKQKLRFWTIFHEFGCSNNTYICKVIEI